MPLRLSPALALVFSAAVLLGTAPHVAPASQPKEPFLPLSPKRSETVALGKGEFVVTIEGTKQGRFKGEGKSDALKDKLIGLAFESELKIPRDSAGNSTGKRQHQPIIFTKEIGAASPQLFAAAATNETLKAVEFTFYAPTAPSEPLYTIKLGNAAISSIRQHTEEGGGGRLVEDIAIVFTKIDVEHKPSKTTASDDVK